MKKILLFLAFIAGTSASVYSMDNQDKMLNAVTDCDLNYIIANFNHNDNRIDNYKMIARSLAIIL